MKVCINVIILCLNKFRIWDSDFWDMAQNAFGQPDCKIFQSQKSKTGCIYKTDW